MTLPDSPSPAASSCPHPAPAPSLLGDFAEEKNRCWAEQGLLRAPVRFDGPQTPMTLIEGIEMCLFASSDYLGLSVHPAVQEAAIQAIHDFGTGSGGSRLTTGTNLHSALERQLAAFFGVEDAVFFATGYQANLSTIATIATASTTIYSDELNHASIIDGCRMSKAQVHVYPHNDMETLERLLKECTTPHALVISDAVFSMTGEVAHIDALRTLCSKHKAWLLLDDAHGVGALGPTGKGSTEQTGIDPTREILIGTASKALGSEGGFVLCNHEVATLLRNRARSYVFSTSPTPATVASVAAALSVIEDEPERLEALQNNIAYFSRLLGIPAPQTPIIPIHVGDSVRAVRISQSLADEGFFVPAIRYPTVAHHSALLRVTLTAAHTTQQLRRLAEAIQRLLPTITR
ncbi:aminotransferase class I/II-fold pyridoxal phosphate-dependent enzyme [Corynebacterium ulcerans]|uniref:aminotransferase class I/II-fold pyridoxal phosphate-dependent enzyme n=1 Tax=Corynebacterium ulcerans TaxID=65058 RepID=UPI0005FEA6FB|nr:8-amino-7-oxononanoate synthase [Corynebacterium ulcerans]AKA96804.1 8-amino-7-oxononanoate synthase [Corynebacterium ulcerans]